MALLSFIAPCACAPQQRHRPSIPSNATAAAIQIQTAVRTAFASGKRRVCVDLLMAAVDARARTYDDGAAQAVFSGLVTSVQPVLPFEGSKLQVVVNGSTTALRVRKWMQMEPDLTNISVTLLGLDALSCLEAKDLEQAVPVSSALLILNPPADGASITNLRKLLRAAHSRNLPVVVQNHPREDAIYELLGYGGSIPYEMWNYEPVFVLAPFAITPNLSEGQMPDKPQPRFVLMRQFPYKWILWQFIDENPSLDADGKRVPRNYHLCEEFDERPTNSIIVDAVVRRMKAKYERP